MPARTGNTTYIPGRGATTVKPSGKKTFVGKGPAPAGATKLPEPSPSEVPTVTVTSSGAKATGFGSQQAARQALRAQRASRLRTKAILQTTRQKPPVKPQLPKRPIAKAVVASRQSSAREQGPKAPPIKISNLGAVPTVKPVTGAELHPRAASKVRRELKQARAVVAKTTGVTGPLTPSQKKIAKIVAKHTPLTPRSVATQQLQEMSGEAAKQRDAEHNYNTLNIGYFDSGPGQLTNDPAWRTPRSAAKADIAFLKGKKYGPSQGIRNILPLAKGKPTAKQLQIIGGSGWASSEYGKDLAATSALVGERRNPQATQQLQAVEAKAKSLGLKVGKPAGDIAPGGGGYVKVRADAKGMVKWAESVEGTKESTPRQLRWAANEGLGAGEPWCANFVSNGLLRRGIKNLPSNPNYVPSYEQDWGKYSVGNDLSKAKPGDLVAFSGEHIGLYVGNGEMISGNFGNEVSRDPVSADSTAVSMILRPPYKGGYVKVKAGSPLPGSTNPTSTSASAPAAVGLVAAPASKQSAAPKAKLSRGQIVARTTRKLKALGIGDKKEALSTSISELERKYGQRAV